jgi:hypothetical protein
MKELKCESELIFVNLVEIPALLKRIITVREKEKAETTIEILQNPFLIALVPWMKKSKLFKIKK